MKMFEIYLRTVEDVKKFVSLAHAQPFAVRVGSDHYSVDGKSFMQMFSLDLSASQQIKLDCTDEEFTRFFTAAAQFQI